FWRRIPAFSRIIQGTEVYFHSARQMGPGKQRLKNPLEGDQIVLARTDVRVKRRRVIDKGAVHASIV
ncbi:hypothetical protein L0F63_005078, partial [Massospora cicadina]